MISTIQILENAKIAAAKMRGISAEQIDLALIKMSEALIKNEDSILKANAEDCEAARGTVSEVMIDRLRLTADRISAMARGILDITRLPSPLGVTLDEVVRPNGLNIKKISVPMGVIAIIYESRPNVTSDAAALAIKSGNVCILRGGKEAYRSARAITDALCRGICEAGLPENAVQLVYDTSRESAKELMRARGYVDMLIPRGGAGLIRACVENSLVPCLETGTGICHIYVDKAADLDMALEIIKNAKTSRPSVCNACEVALVHSDVAREFLPRLKTTLEGVELRCDARAYEIIGGTPASERDFDTEFLDYILAVGVVDSVEEAVEHIGLHSTHHSEAIITEDGVAIDYFINNVDSAAVYVNASTRFTDGGEFGLGCEMGISTQKMHARGPLGIKELTTYKYVVSGSGQIR
jgi:glutamate-5-semialdehyde dehydrogenase